MTQRIVMVGAGVSGMCAVTELLKKGYPGKNIIVIDKGKDPYQRKSEEVMHGAFGAGLFSDGKLVYLHNQIGGSLSKYCGEEKANYLTNRVLEFVKEFHPDNTKIMYSEPIKEPNFIKPYFNLRMAPTWHIGTNYLHEMGKRWYDWLVEKGVKFFWETDVLDIDFNEKQILIQIKNDKYPTPFSYYKLVYATGKSGIDLTQKLIDKHNLKTQPKPVQIGVRFEAPQKYFQELIDISYDFKLYKKFEDEGVSIRSFCTNNVAAYVASEETYGMKSYNGHSYKEESKINNMTNFGILMEIKGINNPFEWAKDVVSKCQVEGKGVYYSPFGTRQPTLSAEGKDMDLHIITDPARFNMFMAEAMGKYAEFIFNYIRDLDIVFGFGNDFGVYVPEVKFLSNEVLVNYDDLSLIDYPDVYFAGDSLSARGIMVSGAQGIYIAESLLK